MATVVINDVKHEVRSLTMREFRKVTGTEDASDGDILAISLACGMLVTEVAAWFDKAPMGEVRTVIDTVMRVSLATEDAQFPADPGHGESASLG